MKIRSRLLLGILIGIFIGVILAVEIIHFADLQGCPENICLDESDVVAISDRGYFQVAHAAFQNARISIHIATFELKYYTQYNNSNENILVNDLIRAHARGVDVKIIVDQYSKENNAYKYLKAKGIKIKYDSEDVTTHAKLVIIDGRIVILGSTNFSYYGLEKNNEVDVMIKSEKIGHHFENYFEGLWREA